MAYEVNLDVLIDAIKSDKVNTLHSCLSKIKASASKTFPNTILADLSTYVSTLDRSRRMQFPVYADYVSKALSFYFWIIILYLLFNLGYLLYEIFTFTAAVDDIVFRAYLVGYGVGALVVYFLLKSHYENQFKQSQYLYAILLVLQNGLEDSNSTLYEQKAYLIKELEEWRSPRNTSIS